MAKFNLAEALQLDASSVSNLDTDTRKIQLDLIDPHPDNFFAVEDDITDLAESIAVNGLCQPLVVTPADGGRYRVIAGHRRRKALLKLAETDDRFKAVTCIVRKPASPEMEMLMLIQTNTAAREIGWNEKNEAATRVEQILVKLQQEQGVKLPGKMRANVAKIIKTSESQIARAKYISEHLIKQLQHKDVIDSVAYTLSHMPEEQQKELYNHYKKDLWRLSSHTIKAYKDNLAEGKEPFAARETSDGSGRECYILPTVNHKYQKCDHKKAERMSRGLPEWQTCGSSGNCCAYCSYRFDCEDVCTHANHAITKVKDSDVYRYGQLLRKAREKAGLTVEAAAELKKTTPTEIIKCETCQAISIGAMLEFCKLYHTDPSTMLGFYHQPPSARAWRRLYMDGTPEVGQLCHVLVTDPAIDYDGKRLCDTWDAIWTGQHFVSAQNHRSQTMQTIIGWTPAPQVPDGYTFDITEAFDK